MLAMSVAAMMMALAACDENSVNPAQLEGLWTGGKINTENMEMSLRFEPNASDSTQGDFIMWYDGTWSDSEDGVPFKVRYSVSEKGTYRIVGNEITFNYQPDKVGVDLNDEDVKTHAQNVKAKGNSKEVNEIADEFGDVFMGFIGETFQEIFKGRMTDKMNQHELSIAGDKLTLSSSDENNVVFTKSAEEDEADEPVAEDNE